jgi:hypothetical protein
MLKGFVVGTALLTNIGRVVCSAKDQLWCSVIPRTDITDIWLSGHQDLGRSKVAQFEDTRCWVEEQVLGFDVSVTDSYRVDIGEGT